MKMELTRNTSHCVLSERSTLENYSIKKELGCGRFAKVWSAAGCKTGGYETTDNLPSVAIKIYRDIPRDFKYYKNEITILNRVASGNNPFIISYIRTFAHIDFDTNGCPKIHPCIVFSLGGDSLHNLVRHYKKKYETGLPMHSVKKIMRSVLSGLAFLHSINIIHTDIKPDNILLNCRVEECDVSDGNDDQTPQFDIMIADLGSSTLIDDIFSNTVGTLDYMAPELIIESHFSTPIDIWAAFVMCYKLITSDYLFDIFAETDVMYGEDVDCEALEGLIENINICVDENPESNHDCAVHSMQSCHSHRSRSNSQSDDSEDDLDPEKINYRLLLLINKLLGHPPPEFTKSARTYYNRRDRLKNNPDIVPICISTLLHANYDFELPECEEIEAFLLCGLKYNPDDRCSAAEALALPFLI